VAICDVNELISIGGVIWIEQCFISAYRYKTDIKPYFNTQAVAGKSNLGIKRPVSVCKKIGESKRGRKLPPFTEEHKNKIRQAHLESGYRPNDEAMAKAHEASRGRPPWNIGVPMREETRQKQSNLRKGKPNFKNRGRRQTEEQKEKLRLSHLGRKQSPATLAKRSASLKKVVHTWGDKISRACMGHETSDETKEKIRLANTGKKQSPETIAKRMATRRRNKELKKQAA
jgi:hypothetical protein